MPDYYIFRAKFALGAGAQTIARHFCKSEVIHKLRQKFEVGGGGVKIAKFDDG